MNAHASAFRQSITVRLRPRYCHDTCSASASCLAAPLAVQNTYVFNDVIHTTSGVDALMSKYISNTINAREALSAPGDRWKRRWSRVF
jgi:hypothetical protein